MNQFISIPPEIWNVILNHVKKLHPMEACGLLGGIENEVSCVFPVRNIENSPTRFRMDPQEQLNAFIEMESNNLVLIAIYHSHPIGPAEPSPADILESFYPDAFHLILSFSEDLWKCRAFKIIKGGFEEVQIKNKNGE